MHIRDWMHMWGERKWGGTRVGEDMGFDINSKVMTLFAVIFVGEGVQWGWFFERALGSGLTILLFCRVAGRCAEGYRRCHWWCIQGGCDADHRQPARESVGNEVVVLLDKSMHVVPCLAWGSISSEAGDTRGTLHLKRRENRGLREARPTGKNGGKRKVECVKANVK